VKEEEERKREMRRWERAVAGRVTRLMLDVVVLRLVCLSTQIRLLGKCFWTLLTYVKLISCKVVCNRPHPYWPGEAVRTLRLQPRIKQVTILVISTIDISVTMQEIIDIL
jgi:hypothetical protein